MFGFIIRILLLCAFFVPGVAQGQTLSPPAACLYESKSYSAGAYLCVQKSLMLTCSSDDGHGVWKIVADPDLNRLCVNPVGRTREPFRTRHRHRPRIAKRTSGYSPQTPAKCFDFNGKRYCEWQARLQGRLAVFVRAPAELKNQIRNGAYRWRRSLLFGNCVGFLTPQCR